MLSLYLSFGLLWVSWVPILWVYDWIPSWVSSLFLLWFYFGPHSSLYFLGVLFGCRVEPILWVYLGCAVVCRASKGGVFSEPAFFGTNVPQDRPIPYELTHVRASLGHHPATVQLAGRKETGGKIREL